MSQTGETAMALSVYAYHSGGRVFLASRRFGGCIFQTPYDMFDWADEPIQTDRVIWACLGELGYAAFSLQGDPGHDPALVGRYTASGYVRALNGVLGSLDAWLELMESDLGWADLEHAKAIWENKGDATTDDFALLGLPSHMIMMQILFGTQEV